jgi:prepilin-type N-terminal cleavage/methylation domain-containing protein/prepilin-type processing-associated H-X9-DG protein
MLVLRQGQMPARKGFIAQCRRAFTLVELLVVIGIIALLIGILMPVLSKAREQGNWAACLSNLKQIGTAMLMYSNENKGFLLRPASNTTVGQMPDDWIIWREPPISPLTSVNDSLLSGILNLKDEKLKTLMRCPSDLSLDRAPQAGFQYAYRYSYTMNRSWDCARGLTPTTGLAGLTIQRPKLSQVVHPSTKVFMLEEQNPNDGRCAYENIVGGADALTDRHGKQGNILFHDWHVERKFGKELQTAGDSVFDIYAQ